MTGTFKTALPMKVAPKNCQKGIWKWPQQMPHRSKAALGQEESMRMPRKPCVFMTPIIHPCITPSARATSPAFAPLSS